MKKILHKTIFASMLIAQSMSNSWASAEIEEENTYSLMTCPQEILEHIFNYLDVKDLSRMACVSKESQKICDDDVLWKGRAVGAKNKNDVVTSLTLPVVTYPMHGPGKTFYISGDDIFSFIKSGKFLIGNDTYVCEILPYDHETPQRKILNFLRAQVLLEGDSPFCMNILGNDRIILSGSAYMPGTELTFVKQENSSPHFLSVAPASTDFFGQSVEDKAQWMVKTLICLDNHYKDTGFRPFWSINHPFDILRNYTDYFSIFNTASEGAKNQLVHFFVQKYVEFRQKNTSTYGDGYYADEYLRRVLSSIKQGFQTNFVSTAYVPPLSYVVENDALPAYIKNQYIG